MSDREVGQDGSSSGGSLESSGGEVLVRTLVPPYRLGELLLALGEIDATGKLTLGSDMGRRVLFFHSGLPVFTQSTLFAERLGAIGVRHGFFGREDVARALAHARERQNGLGESLLELGYVDPRQLYALLGVQLREVIAASCGSAPQRARFQAGGAPLREVAILRLNPLTAVLAATASLQVAEQEKLLQAVGGRRLRSAPLPKLARAWLSDLGYLGDAEHLLQGEPQVSAMRGRLLARHRAEAEKWFDPAEVPLSFPGARVLAQPLTPARVADLVTLTLLVSGAIRLEESGGERPARAELLSNTAESLQAALESAIDPELAGVRTSAASVADGATDRAIAAYLRAARERDRAAAAAVWGPSAEADDANVPEELLRHYVTLKSEKRAEIVLGLPAGASAEQVMQAYARRTEMVASLSQGPVSEHVRCRAAELSQRFDDALDALLPGNARPSFPPAGGPEPRTAEHGAAPRPGAGMRSEALAAKVDALMRAGQWRAVLEALEPHAGNPRLPFTLQLARAMAQRELQGGRPRRSLAWLAALLLGLALGWLARHLGGAPTGLPF